MLSASPESSALSHQAVLLCNAGSSISAVHGALHQPNESSALAGLNVIKRQLARRDWITYDEQQIRGGQGGQLIDEPTGGIC